jgi:hypothetical protein
MQYLQELKGLLPEEDYEIIKGMADTISFLTSAVGKKKPRYRSFLQSRYEVLEINASVIGFRVLLKNKIIIGEIDSFIVKGSL